MVAIELGQAVQAALANQKQTAKTLPSRQRWQVFAKALRPRGRCWASASTSGWWNEAWVNYAVTPRRGWDSRRRWWRPHDTTWRRRRWWRLHDTTWRRGWWGWRLHTTTRERRPLVATSWLTCAARGRLSLAQIIGRPSTTGIRVTSGGRPVGRACCQGSCGLGVSARAQNREYRGGKNRIKKMFHEVSLI